MALEDAWVLADTVLNHPQTNSAKPLPDLREPRVRRVIKSAAGNARAITCASVRYGPAAI